MSKTSYKALGLMSGTSLDGVDAAILETDGETVFSFGETYFRPYNKEEQDILSAATQAALKWNFAGAPPNVFAQAEAVIHAAHIEAAEAVMSDDIDLIGFHGQTVLHRPPTLSQNRQNGQNGKTLQLGNGQVLADALGIDVVYDFRTKDIEAGGQGAPLAPVYHKAMLEKSAPPLPAAVLNIGGVSNITVVTTDGELLATDCGPGNGPLDSWVQMCGRGTYDKNGALALSGVPDFALVDTWLDSAFFAKSLPKSADRWDFDVLPDLKNHSPANGAASLVTFTAMAIAKSVENYGQALDKLIVCGGGRKNPAIMAALREQGIGEIISAEQVGWRGDDLEAEAFAYLAVRSIKGLPLSYPGTTGVDKPMCGGVLAKAQI